MIEAPWTADQVEGLNAFQACGWVHEFTCPTAHPEGRVLVAAPDGWHCLRCGYRQTWAHDFMFRGAPPNPLSVLADAARSASPPQVQGQVPGRQKDKS